jgi:cytochrome c-type biogenesis protein CcmH
MTPVFIVVAALAALATAAFLAWPLWRGGAAAASGPARAAAAGAGIVVLLGSAGLYAHWSNWPWEPQATAGDSPAHMVSQLARRLEREPEDVEGWLMLGRSHLALGQFPLAVRAYQRADRLEGGRNAEALTGWAEGLVMGSETELDGRGGRIFEQVLVLDPNSQKALFFTAVAAQRRGDSATAIQRFEKLLELGAPENIRPILEQQVAALKAAPPTVGGGAANGAAAPEAAAVDAGPSVAVRVSLAAQMSGRFPADAPLFVFVRVPGQPGPPLAVKRIAAAFPVSVSLGSADLMIQGRGFAAGDTVEVVARVSLSGSPTASPGDPFGGMTYVVGQDQEKPLVIDRLTPP